MSEKIIQIIPAPDGLTVLLQKYYDTGETEISGINKEYGVPILSDVEEPAFDDYGEPIYDLYDAVCLALIEDEKGNRSIVPAFYDGDFYGPKNIELASDYNSFRGIDFSKKGSFDLIQVDIQDELGTVFISKSTSRYIRQNGSIYSVCVVVDGKTIEVGEYNSKRAAQLAIEKISHANTICKMPSMGDADREVAEEHGREEYDDAVSKFQKVFSFQASRALAKAGYRTMDEVKSATDDELREKKIQKVYRDSISKKLAKLKKEDAE